MTHQNLNAGCLALRSEDPADQTLDQDSIRPMAAARVLALTPRSLESCDA